MSVITELQNAVKENFSFEIVFINPRISIHLHRKSTRMFTEFFHVFLCSYVSNSEFEEKKNYFLFFYVCDNNFQGSS